MKDKDLTHLLREWRGLNPSADFEAAVWKRIASESQSESTLSSVYRLFYKWVRSGLASRNLAAAAAGIVIGVSAVFFLSGPVDESVLETEKAPFRSLTGAYTEMITGGGNEI